jgi:hypothetical protein
MNESAFVQELAGMHARVLVPLHTIHRYAHHRNFQVLVQLYEPRTCSHACVSYLAMNTADDVTTTRPASGDR